MTRQTDLHNYTVPTTGDKDYENTFSTYFDNIDRDVPIRDVESNLSNYTPKSGSKFEATDTENEFIGDGSTWNQLQTAGPNPSYDSVTTEHVLGTYVGKVRAVSNGEVVASVDPTATTTPISDARDAIKNTGSGNGTIYYPLGEITEDSQYTQTTDAINHVGHGHEVSQVTFPSSTSGGYVWDGADKLEFTGIEVNGGDGTRTSGSAWTFLTEPHDSFNVGTVQFTDWTGSDPVIHFDTGHVYSSDWRVVRIDVTNEGIAFAFRDSAGPGLSIQNAQVSLNTADPCFEVSDGAGGFTTDVGMNVQSLNIGGSTTHAVKAITSNGQLHFDEITWFGSDTTAVVEVPKGRVPNVDIIRPSGGATIDAIYRLGNDGSCQAGYLADPSDDANVTLSVGPVEIRGDITTNATIYEGRSAEVTDNSGVTLTTGISCLGDLSQVT